MFKYTLKVLLQFSKTMTPIKYIFSFGHLRLKGDH